MTLCSSWPVQISTDGLILSLTVCLFVLAPAAFASLRREDVVHRLRKTLAEGGNAFNFGRKKANRIAMLTGGAGSEIYRLAQETVDTFITGEPPHWAAGPAEERGMNLLLGGHYATE